jgi:hypothetical protein
VKLPTDKKPASVDMTKYKFLIYGEPGAGKSTFASKFPDALFIPTEPGLNFLECHQILDDEGNPKIIRTWDELCEVIKILCTTQHQFKTIVIDTIDNAFEFCSLHVLKSRKIEHEADEAFGKGWGMIKREFTKVINFLANSGFGVVFISHDKQTDREENGVKRPYTDNSMSNQAKVYVNGLVDFIFYCYLDDNENRLIRTKASLNINAKDRSGKLPAIMPMDFDKLKAALAAKPTEPKGDKK